MRKYGMARYAQLGLGAVFLVVLTLGLWRGEADDVLRKAIMICLECIGIG